MSSQKGQGIKLQPFADAVAPGTVLRCEMEKRGWSQADLAEILGRPIQTMNQILAGKKAITPATARELEHATSVDAEFWVRLEAQYRLSLENQADQQVARRSKLFSRAPIAEMRRRRWIRDTNCVADLENDVLKALLIQSIAEPPRIRFAARKSTSYATVTREQEAWCCKAYRMAERMLGVPRFTQSRFIGGLEHLRSLGASDKTVGKLPDAITKLGIRFLVVEHLAKTKIDGATFWLDRSRPVVVLSLRYNRIDYFLFSLFHELMHVRYRDAWSVDTDLLTSCVSARPSAAEDRANSEAAEHLVPRKKLEIFLRSSSGRIQRAGLVRFASEIGIHPGVVVGQLQHRGHLGWSSCRDLLVPVRESILKTAVRDGWGEAADE